MNTYTLHVPQDARPGDANALAKADLVKDGFAWFAFLLGPLGFLWFLVQRLWIAPRSRPRPMPPPSRTVCSAVVRPSRSGARTGSSAV